MKSVASLKCVLPLSGITVLLGILLLAAGCGSTSGSLPPMLGGNFSNSSMKGQYLVTLKGIAFDQLPATGTDPFSEAIVLTADGNGNLAVAVDDFNQTTTLFEDTNLSGTYAINKDGTGVVQINVNGTLSNFAITMIDDSHFYVIQQDSFATSSGIGEKQDTTAFTAAPTGNLVFKTHFPSISSRVGGITITGGAISGNEDRLNLGSQSINEAVSGSVSASPDPNGRGTFSLTDSGGTAAFFYFVVSAGNIRFLSNTGLLETGQSEAQTGGPFSTATLASGNSYVFGSSGDSISNPVGIHSGGVFSTGGDGSITSGGAVDFVQDATVNSNLSVTGGGYTLTSNGRGTVNLTLTGGTIGQQIFWLVNSNRAYFLVNSAAAVEDGTFSVQQGAPFSAIGAQAAFFMDGFDTAFKDRVGVFEPGTGTNLKWNQASNSFDASQGGLPSSIATTGSFQVSSNGRATVIVNNVSSNFVFYLSSPSSGVIVQEDADIGGTFATQASQ